MHAVPTLRPMLAPGAMHAAPTLRPTNASGEVLEDRGRGVQRWAGAYPPGAGVPSPCGMVRGALSHARQAPKPKVSWVTSWLCDAISQSVLAVVWPSPFSHGSYCLATAGGGLGFPVLLLSISVSIPQGFRDMGKRCLEVWHPLRSKGSGSALPGGVTFVDLPVDLLHLQHKQKT